MASTPKKPTTTTRGAAATPRATRTPTVRPDVVVESGTVVESGAVVTERESVVIQKTAPETLKAALHERTAIENVLAADAKTRLASSLAIADRAEKAFHSFTTSSRTPEERAAALKGVLTDEHGEPINRGLLLKFLSSVRS